MSKRKTKSKRKDLGLGSLLKKKMSYRSGNPLKKYLKSSNKAIIKVGN